MARFVEVRLDAHFPILSDSAGQVMGLYGTRSPEYRNREGVDLNTPTLILMDKNHKIRWIHQATNFRVRENVDEDLAEAKKLKK
jgi:peroxiredoxin